MLVGRYYFLFARVRKYIHCRDIALAPYRYQFRKKDRPRGVYDGISRARDMHEGATVQLVAMRMRVMVALSRRK